MVMINGWPVQGPLDWGQPPSWSIPPMPAREWLSTPKRKEEEEGTHPQASSSTQLEGVQPKEKSKAAPPTQAPKAEPRPAPKQGGPAPVNYEDQDPPVYTTRCGKALRCGTRRCSPTCDYLSKPRRKHSDLVQHMHTDDGQVHPTQHLDQLLGWSDPQQQRVRELAHGHAEVHTVQG